MLSILIPVYNFDCSGLVHELNRQCKEMQYDYEIILVDDNSLPSIREMNRLLGQVISIQYIQLEKNIGRSKIRNFLQSKALGDYLLFLDCDSGICTKSFIKDYIDNCKGEIVVCGGRVYSEKKPENENKLLHWKYGTQKESQKLESRQKNPYRSFMTNNFLISKSVFRQLSFDEQITGYGHEDSLFGIELENLNIKILHIENPVIHLDIESSEIFLKKNVEAIKNLIQIEKKYPELHIENKIKLLASFHRLKKLRIIFIYRSLFSIFGKFLERNLFGKYPNMLIFSLFKLGIYIQQSGNKTS